MRFLHFLCHLQHMDFFAQYVCVGIGAGEHSQSLPKQFVSAMPGFLSVHPGPCATEPSETICASRNSFMPGCSHYTTSRITSCTLGSSLRPVGYTACVPRSISPPSPLHKCCYWLSPLTRARSSCYIWSPSMTRAPRGGKIQCQDCTQCRCPVNAFCSPLISSWKSSLLCAPITPSD